MYSQEQEIFVPREKSGLGICYVYAYIRKVHIYVKYRHTQSTDIRKVHIYIHTYIHISMGAVENDRKHNDLCVGSMGIRPTDQQRTS